MKTVVKFALVLFMVVFTANSAQSGVIWDQLQKGPTGGGVNWWSANTTFFAQDFVVDGDWELTSLTFDIFGYDEPSLTDVYVKIYSLEESYKPGTILHEHQISGTSITETPTGEYNSNGLQDYLVSVSLPDDVLSTGTYYVALSVGGTGRTPYWAVSAQIDLNSLRHWYGNTDSWNQDAGIPYCFRLEGEPVNSVPEPCTMLLLGAGLGGLLGFRRKLTA